MKRVLTIQDFSCVGRCSLTVAVPVISAAGVECCGIPTALLSNHTGFATYFSQDLSDCLLPIGDKLAELGIINDRRYAEKLCRQLFEGKKLGIYRVKQEMRLKGIPRDIIEETIEEFSEEVDSFARLEELVEKKYERYLTDRKGVNKVKAALARKGYSYGEINEVLELYDLDFEE